MGASDAPDGQSDPGVDAGVDVGGHWALQDRVAFHIKRNRQTHEGETVAQRMMRLGQQGVQRPAMVARVIKKMKDHSRCSRRSNHRGSAQVDHEQPIVHAQ